MKPDLKNLVLFKPADGEQPSEEEKAEPCYLTVVYKINDGDGFSEEHERIFADFRRTIQSGSDDGPFHVVGVCVDDEMPTLDADIEDHEDDV